MNPPNVRTPAGTKGVVQKGTPTDDKSTPTPALAPSPQPQPMTPNTRPSMTTGPKSGGPAPAEGTGWCRGKAAKRASDVQNNGVATPVAESRKRSEAGASTRSSTPRSTTVKKKKRRYPLRLLNRKMRDRRSVLVAMAILIGESNVNMGAFTDLVGVVIGKGASLSKAGIKRMFAMALGPSYSHFLRYDLGVKSKDALQAFNDWRMPTCAPSSRLPLLTRC